MRIKKLVSDIARTIADALYQQPVESAVRSASNNDGPISRSRNTLSQTSSQVSSTDDWVKNFTDHYDTYITQPTVGSSVNKKSRIVGSSEWALVPRFSDGSVEVDQSEFDYYTNLFRYPNDDETFYAVLYRTVANLDIHGNCFWHFMFAEASRSKSMSQAVKLVRGAVTNYVPELLRHEVVLDRIVNEVMLQLEGLLGAPVGFYVVEGTVVPNKDKYGNWIDLDAAYTQTVGAEKVDIPFDEIVHFKLPDPKQSASGLSRLSFLEFTNILDQEAQVLNDSILRRKGFVGGILVLRNVSPRERNRIEAEFRNKFVGDASDPEAFERAGGYMVVEVTGEDGNVQYVPIRANAEDLHYKELLDWTRSQMDSVTGTNVALRGGTTVSSDSYNSMIYDFMENELRPLLSYVTDVVNRYLHYVIGVQTVSLSIVSRDLRSEADRINISKALANLGLETLNQRLARWGHPPVLGGDVHTVSLPGAGGTIILSPTTEPFLMTMQQGIIPLGEHFLDPDELANARRVKPMPFFSSTDIVSSVNSDNSASSKSVDDVADDIVSQLLSLRQSLRGVINET